MRGVVQREYGSPEQLRLAEVEPPTIGADEVLVRVRAASVHPDVWHVVRGQPFVLRLMGAGVRRPKNLVPGTDMAGRVEAVGEAVTKFAPGEAVFGETIRGQQWTNGGAYAEYVAAPAAALALKPESLTYDQAAAVPTSGLIALQAVHYQGQVQPGHRVLVNGAGGGVGTFAVQLAKAYGAEVTGVDSTHKLELLRSIGADHVVDYSRQDFTRNNQSYDRVIDIPGNRSVTECKRALTPAGKYILIGHDRYGAAGRRLLGSLPRFLKLLVLSPFVSQLSEMGFTSIPKDESMRLLKEFLESGDVTPVVDRTYALDQVVDAIQYLESGQVQGKTVISIGS